MTRQVSKGSVLGCLLLCCCMTPIAAQQLRVLALFQDKVMVEVDGDRHFLRAGESLPDGTRLLAATPEEATFEINGVREVHGLANQAGGHYAAPQVREVKIVRSSDDAFAVTGFINGRLSEMVVDTGATQVAMSEVEAKRLNIPFRLDGEKIQVSTASGIAEGYLVMLDKVQVGSITLSRVEAVVIRGASPLRTLLGMSFLKRVEMRHQDNLLILRSRL